MKDRLLSLAKNTMPIVLLVSLSLVLAVHLSLAPSKFSGDSKSYFVKTFVAKQALKKTLKLKDKQELSALYDGSVFSLYKNMKPHLMLEFNYNSSLFNVLWRPLAFMPEKQAARLWYYITISGYLIGLFLMCVSMPFSTLYSFFISSFLLINPNVIIQNKGGQVGGVVAFLVGLSMFLVRKNYKDLNAIIIGLMSHFKYFFLLLFSNLLCQKQYKQIFIAITSLCFITIIANYFAGVVYSEHYGMFAGDNFIGVFVKGLYAKNIGLFSFILKSFALAQMALSLKQVVAVYVLIAACLGLFSLYKIYYPYKKIYSNLSRLKAFATICLLAAYLSPLSWYYYMPCYFPAIFIIVANIHRRSYFYVVTFLFALGSFYLIYPDCLGQPVYFYLHHIAFDVHSEGFYAIKSLHILLVDYALSLSVLLLLFLLLDVKEDYCPPVNVPQKIKRRLTIAGMVCMPVLFVGFMML